MVNGSKIKLYQQAINILTSQGKFYINLGLDRMHKILEIMGNPHKKLKYVHVAGTNGKGSVCAMLSAILKKCEIKNIQISKQETVNGKRNEICSLFTAHRSLNKPILQVGLFTSPHVFEYTERIKINDNEIEKEEFAQSIIKIVELAEKNQIHLTEFEILTAVAFDYFAENKVDIVVLETGLGGRLDATNVIEKNLCSIITHLDFDHTERLGDTIEKIAFEKAGIIKENCPTIISSNNAGFEVIKNVANEKNSKLITAKKISEEITCSLSGTYQRENLALALAAVNVLKEKGFEISEKNIEEGLKEVKHPCRFEFIKEKNIIIDGAHNPNGTKSLRESLNYYFPDQKFKFVFGCLKNKNYAQMMKNLFTEKDKIYFYEFNYPNACKYEDLAEVCEFDSKPFDDFIQDNNTLTVVCGSFYMIKELLKKMGTK